MEQDMSTKLDAAFIARVSLHDPTHFSIQHSQTFHRLVILQHWNIPTNSKVLELGCGQGDCTTVLAYAVGEQGMVVAVDPAELDYGESSRFLYPAACPNGARGKQPTDGSCRCPIYPRPSTGSHLAKPTWQEDYLGPTNPPGLPLFYSLPLFYLVAAR